MVDCFLEQGFNYFDTAHGYLQGKSELALKECLTCLLYTSAGTAQHRGELEHG